MFRYQLVQKLVPNYQDTLFFRVVRVSTLVNEEDIKPVNESAPGLVWLCRCRAVLRLISSFEEKSQLTLEEQ